MHPWSRGYAFTVYPGQHREGAVAWGVWHEPRCMPPRMRCTRQAPGYGVRGAVHKPRGMRGTVQLRGGARHTWGARAPPPYPSLYGFPLPRWLIKPSHTVGWGIPPAVWPMGHTRRAPLAPHRTHPGLYTDYGVWATAHTREGQCALVISTPARGGLPPIGAGGFGPWLRPTRSPGPWCRPTRSPGPWCRRTSWTLCAESAAV